MRLEVRRFKTPKEDDDGIRGPYPMDRVDAEEIWLGPAFNVSSESASIRIALQLIDLNDYAYQLIENGATRLRGGINVSGSVAYIKCEPDFILGNRESISPSSGARWRDEELQFLRFWSTTEEHTYTYDVCARLETIAETNAEQSDEHEVAEP